MVDHERDIGDAILERAVRERREAIAQRDAAIARAEQAEAEVERLLTDDEYRRMKVISRALIASGLG